MSIAPPQDLSPASSPLAAQLLGIPLGERVYVLAELLEELGHGQLADYMFGYPTSADIVSTEWLLLDPGLAAAYAATLYELAEEQRAQGVAQAAHDPQLAAAREAQYQRSVAEYRARGLQAPERTWTAAQDADRARGPWPLWARVAAIAGGAVGAGLLVFALVRR